MLRRRVDKHSGQACYALLDKKGLPLPHFFAGGMNNPAQPAPMAMAPMGAPMAMAPMAMAPMGAPMGMVPACPPGATPMGMVPACPPPAVAVAIVGEKVVKKEDKWTEYKADCGTPYYHNPAKDKTTWEKPKDFDKQKNAGNPPPPTKPKPDKKKKGKYDPPCNCKK